MHHATSRFQYDIFDTVRSTPDPLAARAGIDGGEFSIHDPAFGRHFETRFEPDHGVLWAWIRADAPSRFTPDLVGALRAGQREVEDGVRRALAAGEPTRVRYQVLASRIEGVFSLGGDLALIARHVRGGERDALRRYAYDCVDLVHRNALAYRLPVTTVSLVQGQALGGGFEAALAAHVVVAERGCRMGLPEVLFNLFPGMGAYQLLSRRIAPARAEALIASGRTFTAEEAYDLGLVDHLAEPGGGESLVREVIRSGHRQRHGRQGLRAAIEAAAPLDVQGLRRAADVWVDCALSLSERDLEVVDYLIRAQAKRDRSPPAGQPATGSCTQGTATSTSPS